MPSDLSVRLSVTQRDAAQDTTASSHSAGFIPSRGLPGPACAWSMSQGVLLPSPERAVLRVALSLLLPLGSSCTLRAALHTPSLPSPEHQHSGRLLPEQGSPEAERD